MRDDSWDGVRCYISFFLVPVLGMMIQIPFADDQRGQKYRQESSNTSSSSILGVFRNRNINVDDLKFNKAKFEKNGPHGRNQWWTVVTHMFVHRNPDHLIKNVISMIPAGLAVSTNYGILATYFVFFGGGMFAALQSRDYQNQQVLSKQLALPFSQTNDAIKAIEKFLDQSVRRVAPLLGTYFTSYIGCSSGVAALEGMNVMIWLEQNVFNVVFPNHDSSYEPSHGSSSPIGASLSMMSFLMYYAEELYHMSSGTRSDVDHAGHLAGLCFGLGCFGVAKTISYLKRRLRNRR